MKLSTYVLSACFATCVMSAQAKSTAEIGALLSTGNSESASVRSAFGHTSDYEKFRNTYDASLGFQRSRTNDDRSQTTGQRFALTAQSNYKLESEYSLFGRASYTNDRFASYRQDASIVAGAGAWIFKDAVTSLEVISGPGFRHAENAVGTESGLLWFASALYNQKFGQNSFQQAVEVSRSLEGQNSTLLSRTSYISSITGSLSLRVSFDIRNDSLPAPTKRSTSTETSVSVLLAF